MERPQNSGNNSLFNFWILIGIWSFLVCDFINIYQINNSIKYIKKNYSLMELNLFKKNILYKGLFDIYVEFNCFILCLDLIIITLGSIELGPTLTQFYKNIYDTIAYFNYFFFGPILFGVVVLCMRYGNEITFIYNKKEKINISLDYKNIIIIFIYIFISFSITIIFPFVYSFSYFSNSINFKRYGNYLLGKLFWYLAFNNSEDIESGFHNNTQNVENENGQNNILPFNQNDLLDNFFNNQNFYY